MKIGVTCHASAGGSGILATELAIAMAEKGHEIHFVTFESPFRLTEFHANIFSHYISTVSYPMFQQAPGGLALMARIAEVAEEHGIQLWHAHYAIPYAVSAAFAREMLPKEKRFKVVTTLHGTDITLVGADPSYFRVTKHAMEQSDAVTAVSKWLTAETEREFALSKPVRTIYNFIDPAKFDGPGVDRYRLADPDEKVLMHVSNFRPVKRVTDVVRVFKRVLDKVKARLIMVGDGPERLSAVGVAKQLGILDRIRFMGNQTNIEQLVGCADLIIQPSEHESFGLVPLEAMASRVPVVATASGGICEVVEHGVSGFLCEVGDIDAMAGYAITILSNKKRAREMGEKGRERAVTLFAKDKIVAQYEALYNEVIAS